MSRCAGLEAGLAGTVALRQQDVSQRAGWLCWTKPSKAT